MKVFFYHIGKNLIVESIGVSTPLNNARFKAGDDLDVQIRCFDVSTSGQVVMTDLPVGSVLKLEAKETGKYDQDPPVLSAFGLTKIATGIYQGTFSVNGTAIDTALNRDDEDDENDVETLTLMGEFCFVTTSRPTSSNTFVVYVDNDICREDSTPTVPELGYPEPAQLIWFYPDITTTIGGTDSIDALAVDVSWLNRMIAAKIDGVIEHFSLEAGTEAEDDPDIIRPDNYDPDTNAYFWRRVTPAVAAAEETLHNFDAEVDPTGSDNFASGYAVSSHWHNTILDRFFICTGDGVWKLVNDNVKNTLDAVVDPTSGDDFADGYEVESKWVNTATPSTWECVGDGEWLRTDNVEGGGDPYVPTILSDVTITALTGGQSNKLDSIDNTDIAVGTIHYVYTPLGVILEYTLRGTTAAENAPYIVRSDANPTGKHWELTGPTQLFTFEVFGPLDTCTVDSHFVTHFPYWGIIKSASLSVYSPPSGSGAEAVSWNVSTSADVFTSNISQSGQMSGSEFYDTNKTASGAATIVRGTPIYLKLDGVGGPAPDPAKGAVLHLLLIFSPIYQ